MMKRLGVLALAAVTAAGMMAGCTRLENKTEAETVAATFGDEDIMMDYVMFQMRATQYGYEQMFGGLYDDFWHTEYSSGISMEQYVINSVMASIRQTKVLCDYAEKNGIALSEEQEEMVEQAVQEALESNSEEQIELVGMTEDLLRQTYTENALANVVYLQLVADVDTTVGDDEFIRKDMSYIRLAPTDLEENSSEESSEGTEEAESVSEAESDEDVTETADEETTSAAEETTEETTEETESAAEETEAEGTEADGTDGEKESETEPETTLSEEERIQIEEIENAAAEIQKRMEDGEDPADIVGDYNEDTTYFTATQSSVTLGETSSYIYTEEAFALSEGETTLYRDESTGAIFVLLCTNENNEEARQNAIDTEIAGRESALFSEKYVSIQDESPAFKVDTDVIATINFHTPLYVPETSTEAESSEEESTEEGLTGEAATDEEPTEEETTGEAATDEPAEETTGEVTTEAPEEESTGEEE